MLFNTICYVITGKFQYLVLNINSKTHLGYVQWFLRLTKSIHGTMSDIVAPTVLFSELCEVFQKTLDAKRVNKINILTNFITDYKNKCLNLKRENPNASTSFYPVLRLILPHLERERGPYGLKQVSLAKRLIKILCLSPQGVDAIKLINFQGNTNSYEKDFAEAAYWVLKKHFIDGCKLNILQINDHLDAIAKGHFEHTVGVVDERLYRILKETSPKEQLWLIRIILKDLRLGIGQDQILKLYHPDAVELFSSNNSLLKVCDTLTDSSIRLHEIEVNLFIPFRPMLAQRCDLVQFNKIFNDNVTLHVETKFDGERFQMHMQDNIFKYFSRNGFDYTTTYGATFETGVFTPFLKGAFKSSVQNVILDGEMMGWNKTTKKFGSKGMSYDVKHLTSNAQYQPCFCVFDILLLNNNILTNMPLIQRLKLLDTIITPVHGVIIVSHHLGITTKQEVLDALNKAIDNEEEGIVLKNVSSLYKANDRKAGWWKMKLEYFENVMSDLDLIIMGGYFGEWRNANKIHGFSVGVANTWEDEWGAKRIQYWSLGRVASGLSNDELLIIAEKLDPYWKKFTEDDTSEYGLFWGKDKPHVWISPENSCILLVRASELVRTHSFDFKTDYTLRFPRIIKIRLDKPYYECCTLTEIQELTNSKIIKKLSKRHLELEDLSTTEPHRKTRRCVEVKWESIEQKSDLLLGYEFCVWSSLDEWTLDDIYLKIRENGGTVVKNDGKNTFCILVGEHHPRVDTCKKFDVQVDVVQLTWLDRVLKTNEFEMYGPYDVLHVCRKTKQRFIIEYDKYGDSYNQNSTVTLLQKTLEIVQNSNDYIYPLQSEIQYLQQEINKKSSLNVFDNAVAYFYKDENNSNLDTSLEELIFKFMGGKICNIPDKSITLFVMNTSDTQKLASVRDHLQSLNNIQATIVDPGYIYEKLSEAKLITHR